MALPEGSMVTEVRWLVPAVMVLSRVPVEESLTRPGTVATQALPRESMATPMGALPPGKPLVPDRTTPVGESLMTTLLLISGNQMLPSASADPAKDWASWGAVKVSSRIQSAGSLVRAGWKGLVGSGMV